MNATIRYVNEDVKSTVVILKDGRAMELRRGETTDWSAPGPGTSRMYWPSMAAWASQLGEWPTVTAWKKSPLGVAFSASLGLPLEGSPVTIRPYLANFLGKAALVSSREEIWAALNSYLATRWGLSVYRAAAKEYCLDDFLVTLTGLHPDGLYTARQILNAVLARQVLTPQVLTPQVLTPQVAVQPEPAADIELEVADLEETPAVQPEPAADIELEVADLEETPAVKPVDQESPAVPSIAAPAEQWMVWLQQRDVQIGLLTAENLRLRTLIDTTGMALLNSLRA
jgi:hypothetical protein